jgi:hypothetical protein
MLEIEMFFKILKVLQAFFCFIVFEINLHAESCVVFENFLLLQEFTISYAIFEIHLLIHHL